MGILNLFSIFKEAASIQSSNLGSLYLNMFEYESAYKYFKKALDMDLEMGRLDGVASNYGGLANLYVFQGNYSHAINAIEKALAINKKLNRKPGMASNYANLAQVYLNTGNEKDGLYYLKKAEKLNRKCKRKDALMNVLLLQSIIYESNGEPINARTCKEEALEKSRVTGLSPSLYIAN